jgi:very-short-patch-repair endonuclease
MANELARKLRREMTDTERILWSTLRSRRLGGFSFRRQHPIGPYVVDFVCLEKRFIVEIDGAHHSEPAQKAHDRRRTRWLEEAGYVVFRAANTDVFENLDGLAETILREIEGRPSFARTRRAERN